MATVLPPQAPERASLLDPAVLARIGGLELIARRVVDGFLGGMHRARGFGTTTDFAEHRAYLPGDDVRRIDWRLYARSDRLHVKEFEAENTVAVTALVDVSRSMAFAAGGRVTKLMYARMLAASLLWLARRQRDRVGVATFDAALRALVPPAGRHLPQALHALEQASAGGAGTLDAPLRAAAAHVGGRGIVAVLSDLYAEPEAAIDAVVALRQRGNELLLLHVLDPAELDFPFDDAAGVRDLETGEVLPVVPRAMCEEYRRLVAAHLADLERLAAARGVTYARFDTSAPLDGALARFLAVRESLARAR